MEKSEIITLDLCTSILPAVTDLLESKIDRYCCNVCEWLWWFLGAISNNHYCQQNLIDLCTVSAECMQTLRRCIGIVGEACKDFWSNDTFNSIIRSLCWCRPWSRAKVLIVSHSCFCEKPLLDYLMRFIYCRRERCNLCFIELEKAKNNLPSLTRYFIIYILHLRENFTFDPY